VENPRDYSNDERLAVCRQVRDELLRLIDAELVGA